MASPNNFHQVRKICRRRSDDFNPQAERIIEKIHAGKTDEESWVHIVGECIPRLFTADVCTGYELFHDESILHKVWEIYDHATAAFNHTHPFPKVTKFKKAPPVQNCLYYRHVPG